jgi:hypothetical protein
VQFTLFEFLPRLFKTQVHLIIVANFTSNFYIGRDPLFSHCPDPDPQLWFKLTEMNEPMMVEWKSIIENVRCGGSGKWQGLMVWWGGVEG